MRRNPALLVAIIFLIPCSKAFADVAAIHADALPQETAVLAALDDARQLEPYSSTWSNTWNYPVSKDDVASRLTKDLAFLNLALKNHPDNLELLLLTGLVAHYAYNLDVPGSHTTSVDALSQAQKLAPSDVRGGWFTASLQCQTDETGPGVDEFLALESSHAWDQLPAAFWDDYMACAMITNMPAHTLRADSYLERLHAPGSQLRTTLADLARQRFDPFDPKKTYTLKEVWQGAAAGDATQFTSTTCGVRFEAHNDWSVQQLAFNNGSCVAIFSTGPYKATTRDLHPSILMLVQQPKAGEDLQTFFKKFLSNGAFAPFTPSRCPSTACLAMAGVQPGMYKADGDGHAHSVAFERDQPTFPGLIFESPTPLPKLDPNASTQAFRPAQTQQRIPGKLYYYVLVDTAASIEEPAMKDLDFFLQNLTVE
jgi:hypothetical protein